MAEAVQNYKKHARWLPLFHFFVMPVLLVNVILNVWGLIQVPGPWSVWSVIYAIGLLGLGFLSRIQALTVQDRVIRLEMRLRLAALTPELMPRLGEFTMNQLCSLRFAGDAELPVLAQRVLAEKLDDRKAIKRLIRDWQADHLRA